MTATPGRRGTEGRPARRAGRRGRGPADGQVFEVWKGGHGRAGDWPCPRRPLPRARGDAAPAPRPRCAAGRQAWGRTASRRGPPQLLVPPFTCAPRRGPQPQGLGGSTNRQVASGRGRQPLPRRGDRQTAPHAKRAPVRVSAVGWRPACQTVLQTQPRQHEAAMDGGCLPHAARHGRHPLGEPSSGR